MRVLLVWCPDWPVVAALASGELDGGAVAGAEAPAVVVGRRGVVACNAAARVEGVRRGMRRRDAQARCPELVLLPDDPGRDARAFEPVLAAVEELRPGVAPLRPGMLAIRSPGRFYGGEENAAALIAERVVELGVWDVRIGIADDVFAAEQAARSVGGQEWRVIAPGESAAFLAPLPVAVFESADGAGAGLADLLARLGVVTVGDFAALPPGDVLARFGAEAAALHRLARAPAPEAVQGRKPPAELDIEVAFEPPLTSVEAVCFSVRRAAEELTGRLGADGWVATAVRIEAEGDDAQRSLLSRRVWAHSRWFTAADLVDRVHWQLQMAPDGQLLGAPVGLVRFAPEALEPADAHAEGLWGGAAAEIVDRGVARVQAMLGFDAVLVGVRQGGRNPGDRQRLVPWGERPADLRPLDQPWPGRIPPPAPARVFPEPWATSVVAADGSAITVTERGELTAEPARFHTGDTHGWQRIESWAGPWPLEERWWEREPAGGGPMARVQLVGADGRAWLVRCAEGRWWTEAGYE